MYQWNGPVAEQTVVFRGTSTVGIPSYGIRSFPNARVITGAAYTLVVAGGISGSFGVIVQGKIGAATVNLAGITAVGAAGTFVLHPIGHSTNGGVEALPTTIALGDRHTLVDLVPPTQVIFQSGVATAGISANCTVSAAMRL